MTEGRVSNMRAVSPVVAVILMVAITVILSAVIGTFVLDLGQQTTDSQQPNIGLSTTQSNGTITVTIVTGSAEEVRLLVNGSEVDTVTNATAGDILSGNVSPGTKVTVVGVKSGSATVVLSTRVSDTSAVFVRNTGPIDTFSDGDLAEYSGDLANASVSSSRLNSTSLFMSNYATITSQSGLSTYPEAGDTFVSVIADEDDGGDAKSFHGGILWGVQNQSSYYRVRIDNRGSWTGLTIDRYINGTGTQLKNKSMTFDDTVEYKVKVKWGRNGQINYTVTNQNTGNIVGSINATDETFKDGGFGFFGKETVIGDTEAK